MIKNDEHRFITPAWNVISSILRFQMDFCVSWKWFWNFSKSTRLHFKLVCVFIIFSSFIVRLQDLFCRIFFLESDFIWAHKPPFRLFSTTICVVGLNQYFCIKYEQFLVSVAFAGFFCESNRNKNFSDFIQKCWFSPKTTNLNFLIRNVNLLLFFTYFDNFSKFNKNLWFFQKLIWQKLWCFKIS